MWLIENVSPFIVGFLGIVVLLWLIFAVFEKLLNRYLKITKQYWLCLCYIAVYAKNPRKARTYLDMAVKSLEGESK